MKTISLASVVTAALAVTTILASRAGAQTTQDPTVPVGRLTATPNIVQVGARPVLKWSIDYPSQIKDVVKVDPSGSLTPLEDLFMDVRVLGASVATATTYYPVEAQMKFAGEGYTRIFYDKQTKVNPATVLNPNRRKVLENQVVNFAGRYNYNGWSTLYNTQTKTKQVVALVNGESPPSTFPDYRQPTIESFLRPYLDGQGRVKIGPMDVIYLFELTHTNTNDSGFDLQDLVLLVTFSAPPPPVKP